MGSNHLRRRSNQSFFQNGTSGEAWYGVGPQRPHTLWRPASSCGEILLPEQGWFLPEDLPVAKRIASHIALAMSHERLAEEARQRQALEAHASKLDLLDQSLASLTDTGQLKDLIDTISRVVRQVLPHDGLSVAVFLPDGRHARRYVYSGQDILPFLELMEIPQTFTVSLSSSTTLSKTSPPVPNRSTS